MTERNEMEQNIIGIAAQENYRLCLKVHPLGSTWFVRKLWLKGNRHLQHQKDSRFTTKLNNIMTYNQVKKKTKKNKQTKQKKNREIKQHLQYSKSQISTDFKFGIWCY